MYFLLKLVSLLPLWLLQAIGRFAAFILCCFNSSIQRITKINIQLAYPELSKDEQSELIRQSIRSQCLTYIEFVKCWGMPPQYSLNLLNNVYGASILKDALANKKGVIVVVPHFGCWELLNAWLNLYAQPVIMYKPDKIKGVNRYLLEARQKFNATLVPADETGIRAIFKHLKQGGSATLVSKLASKTQCNLLGLSCIRNKDSSSFDVHCTRLSDDILSKDLQISVDALNMAMQDIINQAPEQYIWSYKRFRNCYGDINHYNQNKL